MIISEKVKIKIKGNNKLNYYRKIGYDTASDFYVSVGDLTPTSNVIIKAKCDFCGSEKETSYYNYNRNTKRGNSFSCSKKCSVNKTKKTNTLTYGGNSPRSSKRVNDKIKKTNKKKYGTEHTFNSEVVKDKIKKTNLDRYGSKNPFGSDVIKNKIKKTNLDKYGSEYFTTSSIFLNNLEDIKNKIKETNLKKYKNTVITKSDIFRKGNVSIAKDNNYIKYLNNKFSLFNCDNGKPHTFKINSDNYLYRKTNNVSLCTVCSPVGDNRSLKEKELYNFIRSVYNGIMIKCYRDGLEIDIYLPELNIGFEFNGLYFHSNKFKDKNYHLNKSKYFRDKGIRIIHIWEDDWTNKEEIIKSQILNWIGKTPNKIYARKCEVKQVKSSKASEFLNNNHIQGKVGSTLKLGLYYEGRLVSIMTFDHNNGRNKMNYDDWNLSRFCNIINTNIIGGFSKILKYFIINYKPNSIITYSDKSWSNGSLYITNGFEILNDTRPDYKYIIDNKRVHKSNFKKKNLGIKSESITEREYTQNRNIERIYDCGKLKFMLDIKNNI
jgi:hypothetical protein